MICRSKHPAYMFAQKLLDSGEFISAHHCLWEYKKEAIWFDEEAARASIMGAIHDR